MIHDFSSQDATPLTPAENTQLQVATDSAAGAAPTATLPRSGLSFAKPVGDPDWCRVPNEPSRIGRGVRDDIVLTLRFLERIHGARNKHGEMRLIAAEQNYAPGYTAESLRRKYKTFMRSGGDWRTLIDRRRAPREKQANLKFEFLQFVAGLVERHQRALSFAAAHRRLLEMARDPQHLAPCDLTVAGKLVKRGQPVRECPGYGMWPELDWHGDYPAGWSYDNIHEQLRRLPDFNTFTRVAARQGRTAASVFRQKAITTRYGLLAGEFYQFDDDVNDLHVNFVGNQRRIMRPLGLTCLDLLSACAIRYGFKPTIWDEATEAKKVLTQDDMFWFVVNVLTTVGYRTDARGTTFILEHGTAAISAEFEQRIADSTGGKVRCARSGIDRRPVSPGMFEGVARGNFRFKAALESFFNLKRNEMAALPGATGLNRFQQPEGLDAAKRYNERLLLASQALSRPEQKLIFPFLEWNAFVTLALDIHQTINHRTEHALEGWEKCGFVSRQFRLPGTSAFLPWNQFEGLPVITQEGLAALMKQDATLTRVQRLSPQSVWNHHSQGLTRLPESELLDLLGENLGESVKVNRAGEVLIERQDISSEPLHYSARLNGLRLPEGDEYLAFLNPYAPERLALFDARRRYVGSLEQWQAVSRNDVEGVRRHLGALAKAEAEDLIPLAQRGAALAQAAHEMRTHNAAILAEVQRPGRSASAQAIQESADDALENLPD